MIRSSFSILAIVSPFLLTTCSHNVVTNKYADFNCLIEPKSKDLSEDYGARELRVSIGASDKLPEYDFGGIIIASHLAGLVMKTERFRQAVLNYEHNGYQGFMGTDMTRKQVYRVIMDGAEKHSPRKDHKMNFVALSFDPKEEEEERVIAFVYSSKQYVYFNSAYLYHNATRKANTVTHEWLHMLGFEHGKDDTPTRYYTLCSWWDSRGNSQGLLQDGVLVEIE